MPALYYTPPLIPAANLIQYARKIPNGFGQFSLELFLWYSETRSISIDNIFQFIRIIERKTIVLQKTNMVLTAFLLFMQVFALFFLRLSGILRTERLHKAAAKSDK